MMIAVAGGRVSSISNMIILIIIPWSTQSPNRVTIVNRIISRRMLVPEVLKVYFLFAKKLKLKAEVVEIKLANRIGILKLVKTSNTPKSITVLTAPTSEKLTLVLLFFSMARMILFNEIKGAIFGFNKNACYIFTNYSKG